MRRPESPGPMRLTHALSFRRTLSRFMPLLVIAAVALLMAQNRDRSSSGGSARPLLVASASDLQPAFDEIGPLFQRQTGLDVVFMFGSTGDLARQVENGAPVDVFVSANASYLDLLSDKGLILPDSRRVLAQGPLVVAVNAAVETRVERLEDLLKPEIVHVALANPEHAPYGMAAKQALQGAGLWLTVQSKLVYGENVRQAAQFVQRGDAQAGLVAASMALASGLANAPVDHGLFDPLEQSIAVIARSPREAAARRFVALATSPEVQPVLQRHGFLRPSSIVEQQADHKTTARSSRTPGLDLDLHPVYLSLKVAGLATAICFVCGLALAWLLARHNFPGRHLLDVLTTLPQVLPPTVLGYYLLTLLGTNSSLGHAMERYLGTRLVFTWQGAVIAASVVAFPLFVQTSRAALEQVDPRFEEVARTLGRSEIDIFLTITLPLVWRGVLSGLMLAFTRALGEFGATLMLAANIPGQTRTLSLAIYDAVQAGEAGQATLLVAIMTVLAIGLLLGAHRLGRDPQGVAKCWS